MKFRFLFVFLFYILFYACNEIEVTDTNQSVVNDLTIQVEFEEEFAAADKSDIAVTVTNPLGEDFTLQTNEQGIAILPSAIVGNYSVVSSHSLSEQEVLDLTGNITSGNLPFNGSIASFELSSSNQLATLVLESAGTIGNIIIRQVYYSGSPNEAAALRDGFIEIYNNSNTTEYIDRWYLGLTERSTRTSEGIRSADGVVYTLPDFQYDWTKSLDLGGSQASGNALNTEYIYARDLYQFPGDGDDYPILPGQAIVIARDAVNHQSTAESPELTIDLSNADFEVFYNSNFDVDNAEVPNMTIIQERRPGGTNLILDGFGRNGFFLLDNNANVVTYPEVLRPDRAENFIGDARFYFMQIPITEVIDGVQGNRFDVDSRVALVFPNSIDAGFVTNPGGLRSSEALIRKITPASVNNDRKVYQDTNNSSSDFEVIFPEPRKE